LRLLNDVRDGPSQIGCQADVEDRLGLFRSALHDLLDLGPPAIVGINSTYGK